MELLVKNIIIQQKEERDLLLSLKYINRLKEDAIADYLNSGLIKLITGPRRAGKSVLALQLLKNKKFAYLNFDDDLLLKNFDENTVIQTLNEVYSGYGYILLDEIQNLPNWELWVNKLYRRGANIVLTGSNSKLLSHELASALTGRFVQIAVFPFSFTEAIQVSNLKITDENDITPSQKGNILNFLANYLQNGGYPETVLNPTLLKNYLSSLFDSILLKDILKRFRIRQTQQLYDLANYLLTNYTNPYTSNQLKTELNFNSVTTVQKFIDYLEEPYLFVNLTRYSSKIKNQQKSPRKIYIIDNGFIKARSFELSPNFGRLLENLIFVELLRRNYRPGLDLFYYHTRNKREIDFLLRKGHRTEQLIQVCYDLSHQKTLKREISALKEASDELSCNRLLIITWDKEEIIESNGLRIEVTKVLNWLQNIHIQK